MTGEIAVQREKTNYVSALKKLLDSKNLDKNKKWLLLALALLGLLLMVIPSFAEVQTEEPKEPEQPNAYESYDYAQYLSTQFEEILGKIEGVGKIDVMVTLSKESENVYATDLARDDYIQEEQNQQKVDEKHVLIEKDGEEEALITTRITPQVQGVIIVCEGGSDPTVVNKLTEAVTASLGIGSNRVAVSNLGYAE